MFKALEDVMDQINGIDESTSVESLNTMHSSSENLESYVNPDIDREKSIDTLSFEIPKEVENKVNITANEIDEILEFLEKKECSKKCGEKCDCGKYKKVCDSIQPDKKETKSFSFYLHDFFRIFSFGCSSKNSQVKVETSLEPKEIDGKKI